MAIYVMYIYIYRYLRNELKLCYLCEWGEVHIRNYVQRTAHEMITLIAANLNHNY